MGIFTHTHTQHTNLILSSSSMMLCFIYSLSKPYKIRWLIVATNSTVCCLLLGTGKNFKPTYISIINLTFSRLVLSFLSLSFSTSASPHKQMLILHGGSCATGVIYPTIHLPYSIRENIAITHYSQFAKQVDLFNIHETLLCLNMQSDVSSHETYFADDANSKMHGCWGCYCVSIYSIHATHTNKCQPCFNQVIQR